MMKSEELVAGLKNLKLPGMSEDYIKVARDCEKSKEAYEKYLSILVGMELEARRAKKVSRLLRESQVRRKKLVNEFDFTKREGITAKQVERLCSGDFLREGGNITLYGQYGVGKTHLAEAIVVELCRRGHRCYFTSTCQLVNSLLEAKGSLRLSQTLKKLDRFDLIVLDELGYTKLSSEGAELFFEFISARYERRSLLITTNLAYSKWDEVFVNKAMTEAAVDRIIHRCETYNIQGQSWRAESAAKNQK